jgi:adenosine deaminase
VIELNPTSNFVVGGLASLQHHPYFKIKKMGKNSRKKQRFTINTDNPGVSGTDISVEYQLMYEALLASGENQKDAVQEILKIAKVAKESFFL